MVLTHSEQYAGVVLSGSTALDVLAAGMAQTEGPCGLEPFNAGFEHRTGDEWLSRDENEVDRYVADPLCGFDVPAKTMPALFGAAATTPGSTAAHAVCTVWVRRLEPIQIMCDVAPMSIQLEHTLRKGGLRVTRPRLAVLRALHDNPHVDTDAVIRLARAELGSVSHQAVYDVLRALTDARLVRRIQPAGSVARYEARVGDNHHHVVCRTCGDIQDVDCTVGDAPCLSASDDAGFSIDEAEVVFWGRCPTCLSRPTVRNERGST